MRKAKRLPRDPDRKNFQRAQWADAALYAMAELTGADLNTDEALRDLLTNLRHYCDRVGFDFRVANLKAKAMYIEETTE